VTIDELRTQSGDVDFHRARRMFCIRNGKLTVGPEGTAMSHLEWFEAEGWIAKDNAREFMDSTIRGIFLPARHALFFYRGVGFFFDAAVEKEASRWAEEIMSALALDQHVEVYVGPRTRSFTELNTDRSGSAQSNRLRNAVGQAVRAARKRESGS
jgi:hypothetical protein